MKGKLFKLSAKVVSLVVVIAFIATGVPTTGLAAKQVSGVMLTPEQIQIPDYMGSLIRSHKGTNGKMLIQIQDLHCNYDAQMSQAELLRMFTDMGVRLVMNEGKWSNNNLQYFRGFASLDVMEEAGQDAIREGYLNGVGYFEITSDADIIRRGVEDKELYKQGADYFFKMRPMRGKAYRIARKMNNAIDALKNSIYSEELKTFDTTREAYQKGELSTSEYYEYLSNIVTNIEQKYPNAAKVLSLIELEQTIDFVKVNAERDLAIEQLTEKADQQVQEQIVALGTQYREEEITGSYYYQQLLDMAEQQQLALETTNMKLFADYMTIYEEINFSDLSREQDAIERQTGVVLCKTQDQKDLFVLAEKLEILERVIDIKVTRPEFSFFMKDHNVKTWIARLETMIQKNGLATELPTDISALEQTFPVVIGFYETANKRDEAYVQNIIKNMNETGEEVAIMITGGFHTDRVTEMMKEQGYSYVVVSPRINTIGTDDVYHKNMASTYQAIQSMIAPLDAVESALAQDELLGKMLENVKEFSFEENLEENGTPAQAKLSIENGKAKIIFNSTLMKTGVADIMRTQNLNEAKATVAWLKQALAHEATELFLLALASTYKKINGLNLKENTDLYVAAHKMASSVQKLVAQGTTFEGALTKAIKQNAKDTVLSSMLERVDMTRLTREVTSDVLTEIQNAHAFAAVDTAGKEEAKLNKKLNDLAEDADALAKAQQEAKTINAILKTGAIAEGIKSTERPVIVIEEDAVLRSTQFDILGTLAKQGFQVEVVPTVSNATLDQFKGKNKLVILGTTRSKADSSQLATVLRGNDSWVVDQQQVVGTKVDGIEISDSLPLDMLISAGLKTITRSTSGSIVDLLPVIEQAFKNADVRNAFVAYMTAKGNA